MDHQQVWKTVLEQLQKEMPSASFDTWVRDTQVLSFADGVLKIETRNAYARQWLEDRVQEDAQRMLLAILHTEIRVEFVVADMDESDEAIEEETTDITDRMKHVFTAEPVNATRYQEEVHPDRVVLLDGYALRLMEHGDLTPKEMSLWVGFRQAVYQRWKQGSGTVKNIPYWEILRFASMSRASYFRETSNRDSLAGGLVEVVPEPAALPTDDRRFDNARRYRVHMAPRLTRRDCAVLESILLADVCMAATNAEAHEIALATLNRLTAADPGDYLNQPIVQLGSAWPKSMHEIVRRVLDVKGAMPADLLEASEKVFDRILRGFGKVLITHYFLKNAAHKFKLTHPQIWAIIALRDRSWYDHETRTQKEFAILPRGLDDLGRWVGVDRKTVKRWLKEPAFAAFVQMGDMSTVELPESWNYRTTIFLVRQDEPLEEEIPDKMSTDPGQNE